MLADLEKRKRKPRVMEFNPWQLSGSGGIAEAFFTEMGIALGTGTAGEKKAALDAQGLLKKVAKRFGLGGKIAGAAGLGLAAFGKTEAAAAAGTVAASLNQMADLSNAGSEASEPDAELPLHLLKQKLNDSLKKCEWPLLVVIDDIDRLTTSEILNVFQLVKVNADFSKVIYLLLFERNLVCGALDDVSKNRGNEFLEKIIQVGYHVPRPSRASVQKVLFGRLNEILSRPGVSRQWDKDRWSAMYLDGLQPFFRNLRHVYRFLSSFDFHARAFCDGDDFEVNPIDLIALEALRVFEPSVYEELPKFKRVLTHDGGNQEQLFPDLKPAEIDATVEKLVKRASEDRRTTVKAVIAGLFPPIHNSFDGEKRIDELLLQEWLREARVCHSKRFDRYFAVGIGEGELSQVELNRLIEESKNCSKFVKRMHGLKERGMMQPAFEQLDAFKETIPLENMASLIQGLSDLSDDFPPTGSGMFDTATRIMAYRLIYFGLRREKNEKRRLQVLLDGFSRSKGTLMPVYITMCDEREDNAGVGHLVAAADWPKLKELSLEKIRAAVRSGLLRRHPEAKLILWRWHDWDLKGARAWVAKQVKNRSGCLWLLATLMGEVHSHGYTLEIRYYMKLSEVEKFADVAALELTLRGVRLEKVGEREKIAVKKFRQAIKRKAEGKPELDGHSFGSELAEE